jgi:microcompartment protein CcmL/EutN
VQEALPEDGDVCWQKEACGSSRKGKVHMAIGFLECAGYGAVLYAMDKACKAANVRIIGIDTINPKDTSAFIPLTVQVKFEGGIDDVKEACETAERAALKFNSPNEVLTEMIENPYEGTKALSHITKVSLEEKNIINFRR